MIQHGVVSTGTILETGTGLLVGNIVALSNSNF